MDMNSGYNGYSMSKRAASAYECGEMPKSKWTKSAIIERVREFCDAEDLEYDANIEKTTRDDLFEKFVSWSSWHHTSRMINQTDFYALDENACRSEFRALDAAEIEAKQAAKAADREAEKARVMRLEEAVARKAAAVAAYTAEHGYAPNTVAALIATHPEACTFRVSKKGHEVVDIDHDGRKASCEVARANDQRLWWFNALA